MTTLHLTAGSLEQTAQIAQTLAAHLRAGDVVLLDGGLAAGKTFFTRALTQSLGTDEDVTSPTYTIANIYETERAPVLHVDAYRLENAREFYGLGLDEYFDIGICVVEWGVRLGDFFDAPLSIHIGMSDDEADPDSRNFTVKAEDPRWQPVFKSLEEHAHA